jgi:hypothetical protein
MTRLTRAREGRAATVERPAPLVVEISDLEFCNILTCTVMCHRASRCVRNPNVGNVCTAQLAGCEL